MANQGDSHAPDCTGGPFTDLAANFSLFDLDGLSVDLGHDPLGLFAIRTAENHKVTEFEVAHVVTTLATQYKLNFEFLSHRVY